MLRYVLHSHYLNFFKKLFEGFAEQFHDFTTLLISKEKLCHHYLLG